MQKLLSMAGVVKILVLLCSVTLFATPLSAGQLERIPAPKAYSADEIHFIVFGGSRKNILVGRDRIDEQKVRHARRYNHFRHLVFNEIATNLLKHEADFTLYTGDFAWLGADRGQWQDVHRHFPRGLRSRNTAQIFPVPGNLEFLAQPGKQDARQNYFATFPYLTEGQRGLHNYYFTIGSNLFISLCSGHSSAEDLKIRRELDRYWNCDEVVSFESLMLELVGVLNQVLAEDGLHNVFVQYHKPSFSHSLHPPLEQSFDPLIALNRWKQEHSEVNLMVFNGHNHTTELYRTNEGVLVLVAGGGGAMQDGYLANYQHDKESPEELFWKALEEVERVPRLNYFRVDVDSAGQTSLREMVLVIDGGLFPYLKTHFAEGVRVLPNGELMPPPVQLKRIEMKRMLHAGMVAR